MTAIDWGWSIEATAGRLQEISEKARDRADQNDEGYALMTAKRASVADGAVVYHEYPDRRSVSLSQS